MNRSLLNKCLGEARLLLVCCAAALYAFCWLRVWLVGRFDMARFEAVVEQFREFERFSPVPFEQLFTYAGRIALTYDEPLVILIVSVWAIARGSDVVSGEIGRGTMEMLLAQPVSRLQVLLCQASVTVAGVAVLAGVAWLGTWTGIATVTVNEAPPATRILVPLPFLPPVELELPQDEEAAHVPMSDKVDAEEFVPAAANLFCLGFFLAGLSTFMSSWDRYRWRTIGIVVGIYVVQTILKVVGIAAEDFRWLKKCTAFTAYEPEVFVSIAVNTPQRAWSVLLFDEHGQWQDLGPLGYDLVLIGLGIAGYLGATIAFSRRDLPAPL